MSAFKPYAELKVDGVDPGTGRVRVTTTNGILVFSSSEYADEVDFRRLVDCWNACRKLYSPANHINETEEYVKRLETLRKEAWARAMESEAKASDDNGTYQADTEGTVRREMQVGEDRALGPATSEIMDVTGGESAATSWSTDISQAPRDGSPVILAFAGKTFKSRWNNNKVDPDNWSMLTHKQTPDAWMPWPEYPAHPGIPEQRGGNGE